jgi:hypothetical protein
MERFFGGMEREGEGEEEDDEGMRDSVGLFDLVGSLRGGILGIGFFGGVGEAGSCCGGGIEGEMSEEVAREGGEVAVEVGGIGEEQVTEEASFS